MKSQNLPFLTYKPYIFMSKMDSAPPKTYSFIPHMPYLSKTLKFLMTDFDFFEKNTKKTFSQKALGLGF